MAIRPNLASACILFFLSANVHAQEPKTAAQNPAQEKEVLVGVNYFAGWWKELPNKWHG